MVGISFYVLYGLVWARLLDRVAESQGMVPMVWWSVLIQIVTWPYSIFVFMMAIAEQNGEDE